MRTYGRLYNADGSYSWTVVETDENGFNDNVYLTTLVQTLKLNLGESPFFGNYGIPATQSVVQQIFPDFYAALTQQQFAPYFASLTIARVTGSAPPVYNVTATCHSGAVLSEKVAV
jgi:hypothetical protein